MPCYHPLVAYQSIELNKSTGKSWIYFTYPIDPSKYKTIKIPCGQCVGCRLNKSSQWAVRCMNENQLHKQSCSLTLTYNDENIPAGNSLLKKDFQDFMKRLRKFVWTYYWKKISYYYCGEYGEATEENNWIARPHYHSLIYGFDFHDKVQKEQNGEYPLYDSKVLEKLWNKGRVRIGNVTFESAAYIARYIMKKQNGEKAFWHYNDIDRSTGEIINSRLPEYTNMSTRPAIGKKWLEKYGDDVYPHDYIVMQGKKLPPPRAYDKWYQAGEPLRFQRIKAKRENGAKKLEKDNTPTRLQVKEKCKKRQISNLKRRL